MEFYTNSSIYYQLLDGFVMGSIVLYKLYIGNIVTAKRNKIVFFLCINN